MQEIQVWFLIGKISWRRKWKPTPVFLPRKSQRQRSLVGYNAQDHKELDVQLNNNINNNNMQLNNNINNNNIKEYAKILNYYALHPKLTQYCKSASIKKSTSIYIGIHHTLVEHLTHPCAVPLGTGSKKHIAWPFNFIVSYQEIAMYK